MSADDVPVTPDDIERATERIGQYIRRTPVMEHDGVTLKLELLQYAGSFKPRGAFNRVLSERELPEAGLIAASGGNHGAALSFVGRQLGLRVEIFMPSTSPVIKRANIERFGAAVTVIDGYYDDAQREVEKRQAETGALMVHPYDHVETVAGQGTMAKELEQQIGEFDTLVVANGGGGFVAGQAAWFRDRVKIVAVEPELSQGLKPSLDAGERVSVKVGGHRGRLVGSAAGRDPVVDLEAFRRRGGARVGRGHPSRSTSALDRPEIGRRARRSRRLRRFDDRGRGAATRREDGGRGLRQQLRPEQRHRLTTPTDHRLA